MPTKDYYSFERGMEIEEIARKWEEKNEMIPEEIIHTWMSLNKIWPFREYTRTRETARPGLVLTEGEKVELSGKKNGIL